MPNKIALITGGAQRLGAAMAKAFHQEGYNLILHYRKSQHAANTLQQELNDLRANSCQIIQADLDDNIQINNLANLIKDNHSKLDLLINNASSFFPTDIDSATQAQWDQLINPNVKAPYFLTQALIPLLKKAEGNVINMQDIHAQRPLAGHSIYCTSKAALGMLTQSLAKELAPEIRVNGIAPGAILWPEQSNEDQENEILNKIPLKRCGSPDDIVRTALFLASSPYITGQTINVDGGRSLNQ